MQYIGRGDVHGIIACAHAGKEAGQADVLHVQH